jgi:HEAT repeat protein
MSTPSEVDRQLERLLRPSGDRQYNVARAEALDYLLLHADEAHPKLLAMVVGHWPSSLAMMALPRFGRPESIPVLEKALREADDPQVVLAAQALGEHPLVEARTALERALGDAREQVVISAAEALAERGDRASCPALAAAMAKGGALAKSELRAARERLGCGPA